MNPWGNNALVVTDSNDGPGREGVQDPTKWETYHTRFMWILFDLSTEHNSS